MRIQKKNIADASEDRHSDAEQSVQGKASEVVGEMGDVFSLSTGIGEPSQY